MEKYLKQRRQLAGGLLYRLLRLMRRELKTERWDRLRHRHMAKAVGNSHSPAPKATAPALDPTTEDFDTTDLRDAKALLDALEERCS